MALTQNDIEHLLPQVYSWLSNENIVAVSSGIKISNNVEVGKWSIIVHVIKKNETRICK